MSASIYSTALKIVHRIIPIRSEAILLRWLQGRWFNVYWAHLSRFRINNHHLTAWSWRWRHQVFIISSPK